jgi:hypothetical protein
MSALVLRLGAAAAAASLVVGGATFAACGGDAFTTAGGDGGPQDGAPPPPGDGPGQNGDAPQNGEGSVGESGGPMMQIIGGVFDSRSVPVAGASVTVGDTTVRTGPDGRFSLQAPSTYTAIVVLEQGPGGHPTGYVFTPLTRNDARLQLPGYTAPGALTATLKGSANFPTSLGGVGTIWVDVPGNVVEGRNAANVSGNLATPGAFSIPVSWLGAASPSATAYYLAWTPDTHGLPTAYQGMDTLALSLTASAMDAWSTAPSTAVASSTLATTIGITSGYSLEAVDVFVRAPAASQQAALVIADTTGATSATYTTPNIPNTALSLVATEGQPGDGGSDRPSSTIFRGSMSTATGTVTENFIGPPTRSGPADGATGVTTDTNFSWTAFAAQNTTYVTAWVGTASGSPVIILVSPSTHTTIPDLSGLGLALPSGATYAWLVEALSPYASVDAMCGPNGFMGDIIAATDARGPTFDQLFATSGVGAFVTK